MTLRYAAHRFHRCCFALFRSRPPLNLLSLPAPFCPLIVVLLLSGRALLPSCSSCPCRSPSGRPPSALFPPPLVALLLSPALLPPYSRPPAALVLPFSFAASYRLPFAFCLPPLA